MDIEELKFIRNFQYSLLEVEDNLKSLCLNISGTQARECCLADARFIYNQVDLMIQGYNNFKEKIDFKYMNVWEHSCAEMNEIEEPK